MQVVLNRASDALRFLAHKEVSRKISAKVREREERFEAGDLGPVFASFKADFDVDRFTLATIKHPETGQLVTDAAEVLDTIAHHYASTVFRAPDPLPRPAPGSPLDETLRERPAARVAAVEAHLDRGDFSLAELTATVRTMARGKATADGLPPEVFTALPAHVQEYLRRFFNRVLHSGGTWFPASWRDTLMVAVPTGGKTPPLAPADIRPITLISGLYKLLCTAVTRRLQRVPGLVGPWQVGFQAGRSTEECTWTLAALTEHSRCLQRRLVVAAMDVRGAFDRVHPDAKRAAL